MATADKKTEKTELKRTEKKIDYVTGVVILQHIPWAHRGERASLCGYIKSLICGVNKRRVSLPLRFSGSRPVWVMAATGPLINVLVVTSNSPLPKLKPASACLSARTRMDTAARVQYK